LAKAGGWELFTQTIDLSDGGALVAIPASEGAPVVGEILEVELQVPASRGGTKNTRRVRCRAKVLRRQALAQKQRVGLAMEFEKPQHLGLENTGL
jgi:hypothetical protein